jgi:nitroimidazol reductase NimA-like FMN-containing flavoprotein (pyridoxamine 5'-phosphate oxidase superfamily)
MVVPDDAGASLRHDTVDASGPPDESTDHRGLRALGLEECLELLRSTPVGRLAFVTEGEPVVFPVNHGVDGTDVVFRTSWGSKLQVAETSGTVAYEVDGYDSVRESGWSVVVKGSAQLVFESADTERYDALGVRSWPDVEGLGFWVRIRPTEITGREIVAASD